MKHPPVELAAEAEAAGVGHVVGGQRPWNVFDFVIVAIALLPASGPFSVLRALRVLGALRLISMVPSMRRVVNGLLAAMPGWRRSRRCWR